MVDGEGVAGEDEEGKKDYVPPLELYSDSEVSSSVSGLPIRAGLNKPVRSKCLNDPMYHRLSNMNMFFSEAFECNYSLHSMEEQHEELLLIFLKRMPSHAHSNMQLVHLK